MFPFRLDRHFEKCIKVKGTDTPRDFGISPGQTGTIYLEDFRREPHVEGDTDSEENWEQNEAFHQLQQHYVQQAELMNLDSELVDDVNAYPPRYPNPLPPNEDHMDD